MTVWVTGLLLAVCSLLGSSQQRHASTGRSSLPLCCCSCGLAFFCLGEQNAAAGQRGNGWWMRQSPRHSSPSHLGPCGNTDNFLLMWPRVAVCPLTELSTLHVFILLPQTRGWTWTWENFLAARQLWWVGSSSRVPLQLSGLPVFFIWNASPLHHDLSRSVWRLWVIKPASMDFMILSHLRQTTPNVALWSFP